MKKLILIILFSFIGNNIFSSNIQYLEGFYKLYSRSFYNYPHDINRNIYYLKSALGANFSNPLYAIAQIKTEDEWEKYRYLMYTHINLKLVDSFLQLANGLDKKEALFYNAPWKDFNIKSLNEASWYYLEAKKHWVDAMEWSSLANQDKFMFLFIEEIYNFEDEAYMIQSGKLDYNKIIDKHLERIDRVRTSFEEMDENTY